MNSPLSIPEAEDMCAATGTVSIATSFANKNADLRRAKMVLLTLHSGGPNFRFPPAVESLMSSTRESVEKCMAVHADTGTSEVAEDMLMEIEDAVHLGVHPSRLLVDLNRERPYATMLHSLDLKDPDQREAYQALVHIYDITNAMLEFLLHQIPASIGFDIHSMADHAPKNPTERARIYIAEEVENDVRAWNTPSDTARTSQIFCNYRRSDCTDPRMSPMQLITPRSATLGRCVRNSLDGIDIPSSFKEPFTLVDGKHRSHRLLERCKAGVVVELKKSDLTQSSASDPLETLVADRTKTKRIARALAEAARKSKKHR